MEKNKLKKGAYFGDIHFGKKSNSEQHNQDCLDFINWFCDNVKKENCDYVAFLGDWNENRSALNINTLNYAHRGAQKLNNLDLPVFFIIGNHDLYYRHSRNIHSVIHHGEFSNFTLIDKPTVVDNITGNVLFCPYMFHDEYVSLSEYLNVPIWAGHFEFKGFIVTGEKNRMPVGPDAKDFKGPKYIFSGHFHKRQKGRNVIYIGNTFPMDFSDADDNDRGMMIFDHIANKPKFINWDKCPKYKNVKLSDILEKGKDILKSKTQIKCLIDVPIEDSESLELKKSLIEKHGLRGLNLEDPRDINEALSDTDAEFDESEMKSIDETVLEMLGNIETEHIENKILISEYKKLKIEEQ